MEYVYAALILHELGEKISEEKISGILKAAGANVDETRVKALMAALENVNIEEALEKAVMTAAPVAGGQPAAGAATEAKEEEKKEEPEEEEEEEDLGLGALFG